MSAFAAEWSVFEQDELVDLLADEPELLALADAIAQTQADARPVTVQPGGRLGRLRAHPALVAAAVVVVVLLVVGAALAAALGGFSHWLSGTPGRTAPPAVQAQFAANNAHSFSGFPVGTVLHQLLVEHTGRATYVLYGFRSGDQLCLRLVARGSSGRRAALSCAPRLALVHARAPVEVAMIDDPIGLPHRLPPHRGVLSANDASASFGFVADNVSRVALSANGQTEQAKVANDAFLAVRMHPGRGSRVETVEATLRNGRTAAIPFSPALGPPSLQQVRGAIPGPHTVQRRLGAGTIGWLNHHQARGQSLAQAHIPRSKLIGYRSGGIAYARVLRPDPRSNVRVVAFLIGKRGHNLCFGVFVGGGGGGGEGCSVRLAPTPLNTMLSLGAGGGQFAVLGGLARDGVATLNLYLADGERWPVPLSNNAFAIEVPRDKFPVALVAYDAAGRIVGIDPNRGF